MDTITIKKNTLRKWGLLIASGLLLVLYKSIDSLWGLIPLTILWIIIVDLIICKYEDK